MTNLCYLICFDENMRDCSFLAGGYFQSKVPPPGSPSQPKLILQSETEK